MHFKIVSDEEEKSGDHLVLEYNKKGQLISRSSGNANSLPIKRVYLAGQLQYIITESQDLPEWFYDAENQDSILKNTPVQIDTARVTQYNDDGRLVTILSKEGNFHFEYEGCESEKVTFVDTDGDTLSTTVQIFKEGLLTEFGWFIYNSPESMLHTYYSDYKFNKKGHWIERKVKHGDSPGRTELRALTYYE